MPARDEVYCPVCGAHGTQECSTRSGRDHRARVLTQIGARVPKQGSGLKDKLYWRRHPTVWHCFKRPRGERVWTSLCGRAELTRTIGGSQIRRPPADLRCGRCDGLEMERRGWDVSGPVSDDWR